MAGNNPQADPLVPTLACGHVRSGTNYGETAGPLGLIEAPADGSAAPVTVTAGGPAHNKAANTRGNSR